MVLSLSTIVSIITCVHLQTTSPTVAQEKKTPPDCSYAHSYDRNCRCTPRRQRRRCRVRTDTFEIQACFTPQQSCETPCNCSGFNTPYSYTSNCQKNCFQTPQVTGWSSPFNCCTPNCFTPRSQPCSPTVKCRRRRRRCPRKCCKTNAPPIMAAKFVESQVGVTQYEGCRVGSGQVTQSCTVLDVEPGCCYPQSDALPVHSPSGAFTPRSCDFSRSPSPVPFRVLNRLTGCSAVQNSCTPPPRPPPPNFQRQCQLPCQGPPPRPPSPKPCGRKPPCLRLPSPCIGVGRQMRNSCCCSPICCIPSSLGYNGCQPLMYSIGQNNCGYPMQNSSCCPKTLYLIEKSFRLPNGCSNQSCCPSACCNFPRPPPAVHIPPPPGIYRPPPPGGTRPPPLFFQPPIPTVFGPPAVPLNISPDYYPPLITPFSYPPPPFIPPRTPVTQPSFLKCDRPSIIFDVPNVPSFGVVTPPPAEYFPPPSRTCCCKPPPNDYGCCCRPNQKDTSCCMKPSQCDICCATQKSRAFLSMLWLPTTTTTGLLHTTCAVDVRLHTTRAVDVRLHTTRAVDVPLHATRTVEVPLRVTHYVGVTPHATRSVAVPFLPTLVILAHSLLYVAVLPKRKGSVFLRRRELLSSSALTLALFVILANACDRIKLIHITGAVVAVAPFNKELIYPIEINRIDACAALKIAISHIEIIHIVLQPLIDL
ncbi:unnamed protein product [Allacma fusca]|uniref:Uncharacterized protein n=1 Tax=Allacma fusca TaxID=39272 RepID=A0A8J2L2E5_9HEXA|nr:unnamed protein product [Allacma fusca]